MITWIAAYLVKTGIDQVDAFKWARRIFVCSIVLGAILSVLLFGWIFNACKKEPKIDEENLQKINSQIEERREAELEKILIENKIIEKSVNDRTAESEQKIKAVEQKVKEAREFDGNVTAEDLKKILEETK
jgi:hypothetical protein